ncbi:MAG: CPBP family intramembrane metalloprotease [Anaerolineae bacterium]|nr:CPBP family intramembrane metalloprotease [Anaerolineae bacterium]
MENTSQTHSHIIRNVVVFTVLVIALGWLGWLVGASGGSAESRDLGSLIFVISPLVVCVALRLFGGDGWQDLGFKPKFKGNSLDYALSVLIYPVAVGLVLLVGAMSGGITFDFSGDKAVVFVPVLLSALVFNFVRNIFEEFGWRGYLTPKLAKLALPNVTAHLITGAIWGIWHLPYYLGLLNASEIRLYTSQNLIVFILFTILGLVAASIAFGEIRLLTGSVWPAVLMHAVSNAIILTLLTGGYARVQSTTELLFTPGMHGILSMIVIVIIGWGMYRRRVQ